MPVAKPERTVCILTNSIWCELNSMLLSRYKKYLELNGFRISAKQQDADLLLLVGCGFDAKFDELFYDMVQTTTASLRPGQQLILAGCWPGMHPAFTSNHPEVVVIAHWEERKLDALLDVTIPLRDVSVSRLDPAMSDSYSQLFVSGEKGEVFLDVATGCSNNCSYCLIKKGKGPLRSQPPEKILEQYLEGRAGGHTRFVLLSDDFGSYGLDLGIRGPDLIFRLRKADPRGRFVVNYLNPVALVRDWLQYKDVFSLGLIEAINIPIQSLSNRILFLMNRNYTADEILPILREIKQISPKTRLVTHCLLGFPTETEEEFLSTLEGCLPLFDHTEYFVYRDREGVPAHEIVPKVSEADLDRRIRVVEAFSRVLQSKKVNNHVHIKTSQHGAFTAGSDRVLPDLAEATSAGSAQGIWHTEASTEAVEQMGDSSVQPAAQLSKVLLENRDFVFGVAVLEAALWRVGEKAAGALKGLTIRSLGPLEDPAGLRVCFVLEHGEDRMELHLFPNSSPGKAFFEGKRISASYPMDTVMPGEVLDALVRDVLVPVDAYVNQALGYRSGAASASPPKGVGSGSSSSP